MSLTHKSRTVYSLLHLSTPFHAVYFYNFCTDEFDAQVKGGVLGSLFKSQYYNNVPIAENKLGFDAGNMNKLAGDVLIVQERGATSVKEKSLYGKATPLQSTRQRESMLKAFTYSEEHSGFPHVFKTSELRDNNLEFAWLLKKMLWLDKRTSALRLKFTSYNGNLKLFIFCNLNLWFSRSRVFYSTDTSSYTIQLKGVNLEPGLVSTADLGVECLFALLVGVQAGQLLSDILNRVLEGDEDATFSRQRRNFLLSFW